MKYLIIFIVALLVYTNCDGYEWEDEQREQDYRDDYLSRHNEKLKQQNVVPQWQIDNENTVKDINRYNLYKDGDKYDNEIITIEKPYYQRGDLD
jgi:hypothetical protein